MLSRVILKRRELLLALGSASFLGVPVFKETLAEAQGGTFPVRFVPIFLPGNSVSGKFNLAGVLSELAPFQPDSIQFTGIHSVAGDSVGGSCPHENQMRAFLTGDSSYHPTDDGQAIWAKSDSIDQIIAAQLSAQLKFSNLSFGIATQANGPVQWGMSFRNGVPQPSEDNPSAMFARLFGGGLPASSMPSTGATPPPVASVDPQLDAKSVLDTLAMEVGALKLVAGSGEQQKLDQHLTSIRELEKQLVGVTTPGVGSGATGTPGSACMAPTLAPTTTDLAAITRQQFDLCYQALNCDLTRVGFMQLLASASQAPLDSLGVNTYHHDIEHSQIPGLDTVQTFFVGEIAKFLNRLKATPEGNGNMLDNSLVLFFTDFSDSAQHITTNIPFYAYGRAGGKVTPGRTIAYGGGHQNLLLRSVLNAFGIDRVVGDVVAGTPLSLA